MTKLQIDGQMLKELLPGGGQNSIDALREQWRKRFGDARANGPPVPDRATLYRWIGGNLPRRKDSYLALCGMVDIDPFAALVLPAGAERDAIQFLYRCFWLGSWRQPALGFMSEFFGHHVDWPPKSIASQYFNKTWRQEDFEHDPVDKANYYAGIDISGDDRNESAMPQVFHFAYCQPNAYAKRWVEYGYVIKHRNQAALVNITGDMQSYQIPQGTQKVTVETWFGESPAKIRIASLHAFSVSVQRENAKREPSVRFCN